MFKKLGQEDAAEEHQVSLSLPVKIGEPMLVFGKTGMVICEAMDILTEKEQTALVIGACLALTTVRDAMVGEFIKGMVEETLEEAVIDRSKKVH
jgi:hypothetical protein